MRNLARLPGQGRLREQFGRVCTKRDCAWPGRPLASALAGIPGRGGWLPCLAGSKSQLNELRATLDACLHVATGSISTSRCR